MRVTPSSVAFCTTKSIFSPRGTHCTRVMARRDSRLGQLRGTNLSGDMLAAHAAHDAAEFAAIAVEKHQFIAAARAQHLDQMSPGIDRQLHDAPGFQSGLDEHTGQPHASCPQSLARTAFISPRFSHMLTDEPGVHGLGSLQVDLDSGLLRGARHVASPNCDARPPGIETDLIVVHGISLPPGEFGGPWIERLVHQHPAASTCTSISREIGPMRVSSHLVVARDGEVTQYVKFTDRAWHAGRSSYEGREACNDFSVGVELEGTDTLPYEPVQYRVLAQGRRAPCAPPIPRCRRERMVGHSDIAPGRKTDPGPAFDWPLARRLIAAATA